MIPQRIQRRRVAGWRMPPGVTYIGRPTRWANPYKVGEPAVVGDVQMNYPIDRSAAVRAFRCALGWGLLPVTVEDIRRDLAGRDVCCWCPEPEPCHGDVLLAVARGEAL